MKNVYLIGCTKSKEKYPCIAEEMYSKSQLFRLSLKYAKFKNNSNDIYILSAKYNLLELDKIIKPYNENLKDKTKQEKEKWGNKVYKQLKEKFDLNDTIFYILAGKIYIDPLQKYIDININNPIPEKERLIGKRMHWLKKQTK